MSRILVLRPEPGASVTAARARALGLEPILAPLFIAEPIAWSPPPPTDFEALVLTSAQTPRLAGPALGALACLPCFAVGPATAAAADRHGLRIECAGDGGANQLAALLAEQTSGRLLHLCGADRRPLGGVEPRTHAIPVYRMIAAWELPAAARSAMDGACVALIHSPAAAAAFAGLVAAAGLSRADVWIAAISSAAATAAGTGWRRVAVARQPRDAPLLELAAELCQTDPSLRQDTSG